MGKGGLIEAFPLQEEIQTVRGREIYKTITRRNIQKKKVSRWITAVGEERTCRFQTRMSHWEEKKGDN